MNKKLIKNYAAKFGMTPAEAETDIVRVVQHVARLLAPQFRFGYHSVEDIEQEGVVEALKVLETDKYDVNRPLENFLYVHVHHRLYNFMRKHYLRLETPCSCCDPLNPPASPCRKFADWRRRNSCKRNLMSPVGVPEEAESDDCTTDDVMGNELRKLLDKELPVELRRDYLQMLDGKAVPKARKQKVRDAVLEVVRGRGYGDEES